MYDTATIEKQMLQLDVLYLFFNYFNYLFWKH